MEPSCPFARPFSLSERDKQSMQSLATKFIGETLQDYEHIQSSRLGTPNPLRWKVLKRKGNITVYHDRVAIEEIKRSKRKALSLGDVLDTGRVASMIRSRSTDQFVRSSTLGHDPALDAVAAAKGPAEIPKMLWMGTVECHLDDLMYGLVSQSEEVTRIKSAYTDDHLQNFATLAAIGESKPSDPFYGLHLNWAVNGVFTKSSPVWRNRDFVYLEATGMTTNSSGQRIGYQILHSLDVRGVPELTEAKLTRGKITIYQLFRQKAKGTVEVFAKALVDLKGGAADAMASFVTSEAAGTLDLAAKCARRRKLNWLLSTVANAAVSPVQENNSTLCNVCTRQLHKHFAKKKSYECRVCAQRVCHRCRISPKLSFLEGEVSSGLTIVQKSVAICTRCVHTATQTNARRVALEERSLETPASMYKYVPSRKKPASQRAVNFEASYADYDITCASSTLPSALSPAAAAAAGMISVRGNIIVPGEAELCYLVA